MHETPQNSSKYTLNTVHLWTMSATSCYKNACYTFLYGYFKYFFKDIFLQLIWFNPRLLQDVGDCNYCLGWYQFFNLDRRRSELPKSHRGCWSLWWGHFKFFFSIISFLKTNVTDVIWSLQHFLAFYET